MRVSLVAICLVSFLLIPMAEAKPSSGSEYVTSEGTLTTEKVGPSRTRVRVSVVSGPNAHICEFDEVLTLKGTTAVFTESEGDGSQNCVLTFRFSKDVVEVEQEGSCDCGMQAEMRGTYLRQGSFKGRAPHPAKGSALKRLVQAERDEAAALKRVEQVYQGSLFKRLRERLAVSEARWRELRDADALFESDYARGTPWGEVANLEVREQASKERAQFLTAVLHQESSDIEVLSATDAQGRLAGVDERLNQLYRALRDRLDAEGKQKLLTAQRAWLRYRDAQCAFETERWANDRSGFKAICLARLTEERYGQIKRWYQSYEER